MPPTSESQSGLVTSLDHAAANPSTTTESLTSAQDDERRQPPTSAAAAAELAGAKISLYGSLRRFADFPIKGISFIDIMPLFQDPKVHNQLLHCLELQVRAAFADRGGLPQVIVGLESRGFLFGPSLALRLDAGFAPVRKKGKLPGSCITASYVKEYGEDFFQMQEDAIKPGQKVLVVDDIIATGGSAAAAGELVTQLGGDLMGYLFCLEISFLKGRDKLGGKRMVTLLEEAEA